MPKSRTARYLSWLSLTLGFLRLPLLWALVMVAAYGLDMWWLRAQGTLNADLALRAGQVFATLAVVGVAVLVVVGVARRLRPRLARSACLISGLLATLAGAIAFSYELWGPVYRESGVFTSGERLPAHSHGLIAEGIEGLVLLQLISLAVELTGVAVGSYLSFRGGRLGRPFLRTSTILLSLQASVSFLTIGWLFAPSALLAIVSSMTAPAGDPPSREVGAP